MNPWLAAMLAAAGVWLLHSRSSQQAQNQAAAAGTQAGAGQTSDQGGADFTPENPVVPYSGGVTQPLATAVYSPPGDGSGSPSYSAGDTSPYVQHFTQEAESAPAAGSTSPYVQHFQQEETHSPPPLIAPSFYRPGNQLA